jgi:DNA-binding SARP family transcriptional activator
MYALQRGVVVAGLEVSLFGPPRIAHDGVPLPVERHKTLALLAYLAVTRQPHGRDMLAALLWPEESPGHGRAGLRNALLGLSHAIGHDRIAAEEDRIALREDAGLRVDVTHFSALIAAVRGHHDAPGRLCDYCLASLEEAAGLYRADFLEGFTLRDTADFDAWQTYHTERLRTALANVLEKLAWGLAGRGDYAAAIGHAQRWSSLHPANEAAARCLMQLYAAAGDRAMAAHQYRVCREALAAELGVAPEPATTALYEALMRGEPVSPGSN